MAAVEPEPEPEPVVEPGARWWSPSPWWRQRRQTPEPEPAVAAARPEPVAEAPAVGRTGRRCRGADGPAAVEPVETAAVPCAGRDRAARCAGTRSSELGRTSGCRGRVGGIHFRRRARGRGNRRCGRGACRTSSTGCDLDNLYNVLGFNENSNDLTTRVTDRLDQIIKDIGDNVCTLPLTGYSSTQGDFDTNALFAIERAQNVLRYLRDSDLEYTTANAVGAGETDQFGPAFSDNRRVVITVTP